jgi:hypothetical protein
MTAVRYAERTQQIVTGGLAPTLTADLFPAFQAVTVVNASGDPGPGAPPRDTMPRLALTWHDSPLWPGAGWNAGDRLDVDGYGIVELLDAPAAIYLHAGVMRWTARAMPVTALRPMLANVVNQAGAPLAGGSVTVAVWRPSKTDRARGETVDYQGEAGVEHAALLTPENRRLQLAGGSVLRVTGATVETSPPRVMLELRAPDG